MRELLQSTLMYLLLPLWVLAGFGDWLSHRVQRIELTAGLKESLLHLLMLAELGPAFLAVLLCEVDSLVIVLLAVACVAHELTVWWDLRYAVTRREIPVVEQWMHSLQIVLPWAALVGLSLLHWPQAVAAVGLGSQSASWQLEWKRQPLPPAYVAAAIAAGVLLIVLPYLQECLLSWRVRRSSR